MNGAFPLKTVVFKYDIRPSEESIQTLSKAQ